jgi:hypothetical protein
VAIYTRKVANADRITVLILNGFRPLHCLTEKGDKLAVLFKNTKEFQQAYKNFRELPVGTAGQLADVRNLLLSMLKGQTPYDPEALMQAARKDAA